MRVIIQQHGAGDVVALHLWVGVGGRDEGALERGFSHFVEHLLFKGTNTRGPRFVNEEVEAIGGRTNAGTSNDYTFYYMLLPVPRVPRGIQQDRVSEEEWGRAITAVEAQRAFSTETVEGLASPYGGSETVWTLADGLRYVERIRAVMRAEIRDAARKYLTATYARLAFMPDGKRP